LAVYLVGVFGLLNIRKPPGPTSHDMVDVIRRRLLREVKVGHAGTLDPFAEGVLVVCLGPAVRLASYIQDRPKTYLAEVVLGATSSTDDITGQIIEAAPGLPPDERQVRAILQGFTGEIQQVPPAYSAVHLDGQRAYKVARAGGRPDLSARTVVVHSIDLVRYEYPRLELEVACGAGTYIRAIARDIGDKLGTGGYCAKLIRTRVGPFGIEDAHRPEEAELSRHLLPAVLAVEHLEKVELDADACLALAAGRPVRLPAGLETVGHGGIAPSEKEPPPGELAVLDRQGELVAIAKPVPPAGTIRAIKVFRR
jgi:tRNA pseudouridine55 synthase